MPQKIRMTCPELWHVEHLYYQGYGCKLIAQQLDRSERYIEQVLMGDVQRHRALIGRLSNGKRPASELARSWEVSR